MIKTGLVAAFAWQDNATGDNNFGTSTTQTGDGTAFENPHDRLGTGRGTERIVGRRANVTVQVYDPAFMDALNTQMKDETKWTDFRITWAQPSTTSRYNKGRIMITPQIGNIPDGSRLYTAPVGTKDPDEGSWTGGTTPADWVTNGWTDWGMILAPIENTLTPNGTPDGENLQMLASATAEFNIQVDYNKLVTASDEATPYAVAIQHPGGAYLRLNSMFLEKWRRDIFGTTEHRTTNVRLHNTWGDGWLGTDRANDTLFFKPNWDAQPAAIYGFLITGEFFGYSESDYLTETPAPA